MAININFLANTKDVTRGGNDLEKTFEGVADSLDDLAREGSRSGDRLGDGIGDGVKDADRNLEKLERGFKELADVSKKETRAAGDDVGKNIKRGTTEASDGVNDFKQEAKQNAEEVASSFDGSAQSIGDGFQSVAATAFAGFGPAGAIAGLALAAGLGVGFAALEKGTEKSEEFRVAVGELTAELIEAGREGAPSLEYLVDKLKSLATESDEALTNLADLSDTAKESGNNYKDLAQAYAGSTDELDKLVSVGKTRLQQLKDEADLPDLTPAQTKAVYEKITAQEEYNAYLDEAKTKADDAAAAQTLYAKAGGPEMEARAEREAELADKTAAATEEAANRKQAALDVVDAAYDTAAGSLLSYIDTETGILNVDEYIVAMQKREQAIKEYHETIATSGLTPEAIAFLNTQGEEAAAQFLAGYQSAGPAQKDELNRFWTEAGQENSGQYAGALQAGMPATVQGPTVTVGLPDLGAIRAQISAGLNAGGAIGVRVVANVRNGVPVD